MAARVVKYSGTSVLRVFHLNRMSEAEKRRFRRMTGDEI